MAEILTNTQKATAQAVLNIFETGLVLGEYGQVTVTKGDTGHLTFGRSQTTLGSGNLTKLIRQYCATPGARFAELLNPYQTRLDACDTSLDSDFRLHNLLRATADDVVMRDVQDRYFDDNFWSPAVDAATAIGLAQPLSITVVYDGYIQGSWSRIRDDTIKAVGSPGQAGERAWIMDYVNRRREWLASSSRADLRATVYRMDAFQRLAALDAWELTLPLVVRSNEISSVTLAGIPPHCFTGPVPGSRPLALQSPLLSGLDARLLQVGLSERGVSIIADGIFGNGTSAALKSFQAASGLPTTGVAAEPLIVQLTEGL